MIGLFCPSCGCACCNTHRLHDSDGDITWAESVRVENRCGAIAYDLTTDSNGDLYVVGGWWRKVEGESIRRYQVQKWNAAGVQQWATDVDLQFPGNEWQYVALGAGDAPPVPHLNLTSDDEHVWLSSRRNAAESADLWKLDASDGSIVWSVETEHEIWDICPNGDGGVLAGIRGTDGAGYLVEIDDDGDQVGDAFGDCGNIATRLATDGTAVYVAFNNRANCLCHEGHVAKHDIATRELLWQWYRDDMLVEGGTLPGNPVYSDQEGPGSRLNPVVGLDVAGGNLYVAYIGWTQTFTFPDVVSQSYPMLIEQWDADTAEVLWGRELEKDDTTSGLYLTGITTDGTHVWTGSRLTTYKLDTAGDLIQCQPAIGWDLLEADGSGGVYLGGLARTCTPVMTRDHLCNAEPNDCEKDGTAADVEEIGDTVGGCTIMPGEPSPVGGIIAYRCDAEEVPFEDVATVTIPCTVPDVFDATQLGPTFTDDAVEFEWVYQEGGFWQAQFNTTCCADGELATYTVTLRVTQRSYLIDEEDECSHWVLEGAVQGWCDGEEPDFPVLTTGLFDVTDCWCLEGSTAHPWFDFEYVGDDLSCCAESCDLGILSLNCLCERIPCQVPDTFYGSGCFEEITPINHTWSFVNYGVGSIPDVVDPVIGGRWQTQFDIPCGDGVIHVEIGAVEYQAESGCGWSVSGFLTASASTNCLEGQLPVSFFATVNECPCSAESPYGHPWFSWSMNDMDFGEGCVCCDEGGGGNEPPGGVEVACCPEPVPRDLVASFTGCISGSVPLTYSDSESKWLGTVECSGVVMSLALRCQVEGWILNVAYVSGTGGEDCDAGDIAVVSGNCEPLTIEFAPVPVMDTCACCPEGGFYIITITE